MLIRDSKFQWKFECFNKGFESSLESLKVSPTVWNLKRKFESFNENSTIHQSFENFNKSLYMRPCLKKETWWLKRISGKMDLKHTYICLKIIFSEIFVNHKVPFFRHGHICRFFDLSHYELFFSYPLCKVFPEKKQSSMSIDTFSPVNCIKIEPPYRVCHFNLSVWITRK